MIDEPTDVTGPQTRVLALMFLESRICRRSSGKGERIVVTENHTEVLRQISDIADSAGVVNQIDRTHRRLVMAFTLEPGRTHIVYLYPSKSELAGQATVTVSSPCTILKRGSKPQGCENRAPEPILIDGCQPSASYEVLEFTENSVVVASLVHDVDSLDENELLRSLACVATAAESYDENFATQLS